MGISWLDQVVMALQAFHIRAERGYPATAIPEPSEPVAAVSAEKLTDREAVIAVTMYTTAKQGGIRCENAAWAAVLALQRLGAVCTMGSCSFNGRSGRFSVRVLATFTEYLDYLVKVDQVAQPYVTDVTTEKKVELTRAADSETGEITVSRADGGWELTLTERMPADTMLEKMEQENFSITIVRPGGAEMYPDCRWSRIVMQDTPEGLQRTRVARTWSDKIVALG